MNRILLILLLFVTSCEERIPDDEKKLYQQSMNKAQESVTGWIKNNALYPGSYESLSFTAFTATYSKKKDAIIPGSEKYVIRHRHRLLDKDSSLVVFTGYFILDHNFSVKRIETTRSNSTGGDAPPQTRVWTDLFGRPENRVDSLTPNS